MSSPRALLRSFVKPRLWRDGAATGESRVAACVETSTSTHLLLAIPAAAAVPLRREKHADVRDQMEPAAAAGSCGTDVLHQRASTLRNPRARARVPVVPAVPVLPVPAPAGMWRCARAAALRHLEAHAALL